MLSVTEENYLKAIGKLAGPDGMVNTAELSKMLRVSPPTVHSMVKKLGEKGFISYKKYQPIVITTKGRRQAACIIRRHRLTEMFLQEKLGFDWEHVHEIAEQIEHVRSTAFFDRMDEMLGFPRFDPHGSPIPDRSGEISERKLRRLSNCFAGDQVRLAALGNTSKKFLSFLNKRELGIGTIIVVVSIEPYDGSMEISCGDNSILTLGKVACDDLLVEDCRQTAG